MVKSLVIDHRARITVSAPQRVRVEVQSATADGLGADLLRFSGIGYHADGEPFDRLLVAVLIAGRGRLATAKQQLAVTVGGAFLAPMDSGWETDMHDMVYALVRLPLSEVAEYAAEVCDLSGRQLRFHGLSPLAGTQRVWADTSTFLYRQLVESRVDGINPLVLHGLKRLTATALLATFPNTTMTVAYTPEPGQTTPAVIRRAAQFIDEHAAEPLTVTAIAAAVRVSPRALQAGFRRHLGTTPLTYLRHVRLTNTHHDLQAADPTQGVTVAAIAARWGFTHPARFAAWYRKVYGIPPSQTLRT
ncbi:helix-turn-helix transcriptional regulator [Nocardia sp. IFM 10818]